ncbi:MAG: RDD family protein, partial [Actinomycetota bacterium]|nr:RDD family protein [Actinomycetota bacterium]
SYSRAVSDPFAGAEPTLPPYASWGRRFAAIVVDNLLLALPLLVAIVVAAAVTGAEDGDDLFWTLVVVAWALWIVAPFVYFTVLHGRGAGQTVGKRLLGIRVIGEDFRPLGYGRAFGRYLVAWVLWLACYVPGILDALWPMWDDKNQSLHDKVANSMVVRA